MNKNIFLLLLALFVSGEVFGQNRKSSSKKKERVSQSSEINSVFNKARIDTKEGSRFIGEYLGETDKNISLKLSTGDEITLKKETVKNARTPLNSIVLNRARYHRTKGLYIHYNFGVNLGNAAGGIMGDIGLGYRINRNWEVQAGIGFFGTSIKTPFNAWSTQKSFFPSYVGAVYNINHGKARLFASGRIGYSNTRNTNQFIDEIFWNPNRVNMTGGAYFEPGIGLTFAGKRIGRSQIIISQMLQHSKFDYQSIDNYDNLVSGTGKMWIRRIGIRFTTTVF